MSNITKNKQKTINLKSLILQPYDNLEFKYLKLSTLRKLFNTCNKELTERSRRPQKILKKDVKSEICKTSREFNNNNSENISNIIFNRNQNTSKLNSYKTLNQ